MKKNLEIIIHNNKNINCNGENAILNQIYKNHYCPYILKDSNFQCKYLNKNNQLSPVLYSCEKIK